MKRASLALLALLASLAAPAFAQEPRTGTPEDAVAERSTAFEAVEGASRENVSGLGLMVGAYGLVWAFTLSYLLRIGRLESRLAADVERLEKALGSDDSARG